MYFEKLLFYKWRYERTGGSTSCHQITGVIAEKLLIVFHCASEFIYTVFNICNPTTAPLFVCSYSKKKNICVASILGIKRECPIYLEYNIAKYLQRAALPEITRLPETFLYVHHGNKVITRSRVFPSFFFFLSHYFMAFQKISQLGSK